MAPGYCSVGGLPGGSGRKELAYQCRRHKRGGSKPQVEIPGEGNGHPLQRSGLENRWDRGAQGAAVHGVTQSRTRQQGPLRRCLPARGSDLASITAEYCSSIQGMKQCPLQRYGWT